MRGAVKKKSPETDRSSGSEIALKSEDFSELQNTIYLENNTTLTHIYEPNKVRLVSFDERELSLDCPRGSCASGHHMTLFILGKKMTESYTRLDVDDRRALIVLTAKVSGIEHSSKTKDLIELEVVQVDGKQWASFLARYSDKQTALNAVLERIKG